MPAAKIGAYFVGTENFFRATKHTTFVNKKFLQH
jgi:hypothetical protein